MDRTNTVKTLRDQLLTLTASENDDGGFPILRHDTNAGGMRMVGFIGANELEHALSKFVSVGPFHAVADPIMEVLLPIMRKKKCTFILRIATMQLLRRPRQYTRIWPTLARICLTSVFTWTRHVTLCKADIGLTFI